MVKQNKGFTLIELLIIIGIIGFLAAAILVAVDPVRRIQEARNVKRWSEVNSILNAYLNKQADEGQYYIGYFTGPGGLPWTMGDAREYVAPVNADKYQVIISGDPDLGGVDCQADTTATPTCDAADVILDTSTATSCIADLEDLAPEYIAELPLDPHGAGWNPSEGSGNAAPISDMNTGYYVHRTSAGRIQIGACWPERDQTIRVMR